jgi:hypothetical protein
VLNLRHGLFEFQGQGISGDNLLLSIRARDHGDCEIAILAASLRWAADRLTEITSMRFRCVSPRPNGDFSIGD